MDANLFDALRYRSEGTDLDFKQAQYRFVRGTEADKGELLKDVLAMANTWREGTGYILLGFKDARPNPAQVVGITEHIDDAAMQQFINSKVKPKVSFRYEEHIYDGQTVAVIAIPKQQRPFYLQHAYSSLKSNVVYVRRGSSTDEAEPPEVAKMAQADAGHGEASVELLVTLPDNSSVEAAFKRSFLTFEKLPDYEPRLDLNPYGLATSIWRENSEYWRDLAQFVAAYVSTIELQYCLTNRSTFALTGAKLEVTVAQDDTEVRLSLGTDLPDFPKSSYNSLDFLGRTFPDVMARREPTMTVDAGGGEAICHIRLGTLLPGESARAADTLAIRLRRPGRITVRCRILAAELPTPIERQLELAVTGTHSKLDLDGLRTFAAKESLARSPVANVIAQSDDEE